MLPAVYPWFDCHVVRKITDLTSRFYPIAEMFSSRNQLFSLKSFDSAAKLLPAQLYVLKPESKGTAEVNNTEVKLTLYLKKKQTTKKPETQQHWLICVSYRSTHGPYFSSHLHREPPHSHPPPDICTVTASASLAAGSHSVTVLTLLHIHLPAVFTLSHTVHVYKTLCSVLICPIDCLRLALHVELHRVPAVA